MGSCLTHLNYLRNKMGHAIRIFLIASCLLFSTVYAQSVRLLAELGKKDIHIAAHRGVHTQYPENSIPAILEAISLGVSIVEIDVRSTKDGVLLVMHDATVDRTTTGKGTVSNLTYADIQELYLRETPHGSASPYQVPTLQEVLRICKGKIIVDIDFKEENKKYIANAFDLIAAENMIDEVLFFLYDHQDMKQVYSLHPMITLFPRARNRKDLNAILKSKLTSVVHIDESFQNVEHLKKLKDQGVILWMNSLGDIDKQALRQGNRVYELFLKEYPYIKIIQTDYPALWTKMLGSENK